MSQKFTCEVFGKRLSKKTQKLNFSYGLILVQNSGRDVILHVSANIPELSMDYYLGRWVGLVLGGLRSFSEFRAGLGYVSRYNRDLIGISREWLQTKKQSRGS